MSLKINSAKYGVQGQFVDVADLITSKIVSDKLYLSVSNSTFDRDPAPLKKKVLIVEYELDGETHKKTLSEGVVFEIPERDILENKTGRLKLELPEVTLCSFCWGNESFLSSLVWAYKQFNYKTAFAEKVFFISSKIDHVDYGDFFVEEGIQVIPLPEDFNISEYSRVVVKELNSFIESDYVMIFQNDGLIENISKWNDEFLNYDYIGAPWWYKDDNNVGNGGFSIRSKKLLKVLASDPKIDSYDPEDHHICRVHGDYLRDKHGISFAPEDLASKFSVETGRYINQFGFHGAHQLEAYLRRISS